MRYLSAALATPVDKDQVAAELTPMRALFGRSLVARCALPPGHLLTVSDLIAKKPAGGVPPSRLESLIGRRLRRAVAADDPVQESFLD